MMSDSQSVGDIKSCPHIVIHSGQILQNLLPMMALGASEFLVIHSSSKKPDGLIQAAKLLGIDCVDHVEIDYGDVNTAIAKLNDWRGGKSNFDFSNAVLNYTGGTKPMSLAAVAAWSDQVKESVYFDSGALYRTKTGQKWAISNKWTVVQLLQANGYADKSSSPNVSDMPIFQLSSEPSLKMRKAAKRFCSESYMTWLGNTRGKNKRAEISKGTLVPENIVDAIRYAKMELDQVDFKLEFYEAIWLEVWVWDVLTRHKVELGLDDVQHSVQIYRINQQNVSSPETDLDVAFSINGRLGFISCKTSKADELFDEVWEVAVRRAQFGGAFGMGMLVHWHLPAGNKTLSQKSVKKAVEAASKAKPEVVLFDRECLLNENLFVSQFKKCIGPVRS